MQMLIFFEKAIFTCLKYRPYFMCFPLLVHFSSFPLHLLTLGHFLSKFLLRYFIYSREFQQKTLTGGSRKNTNPKQTKVRVAQRPDFVKIQQKISPDLVLKTGHHAKEGWLFLKIVQGSSLRDIDKNADTDITHFSALIDK